MKKHLVLSLCLVVSMATPGLAQQTGKAALDEWLKSYTDLGAKASYDTAEMAGDTLTVRGLDISFSTSFTVNDPDDSGDPETVKVGFSWKSPELIADDLRADAKGFSVDDMAFANGTSFVLLLGAEGEGGAAVDVQMDGYVLTRAFWPRPPKIADDPDRPFSRWLPLVRTLLDFRFEEERIERLLVEVSAVENGDHETLIRSETEDIIVRDMRDGRVAEYSSGQTRQEATFELDNGETHSETTTIASSHATNINFEAMLALWDQGAGRPGQYIQALASASVNGYRVKSDHYDMVIDHIGYKDFAILPPQTSLLAPLDALASGREPEPSTFALAVLDMYRSFAVGRMSVDGISVGFDTPDESGSGEIGQILFSDFSAAGLGEFSISSVNVDMGDMGRFTLGKFLIGNIEFAPYGPIRSFIENADNWDEPDPLEVARIFTPRSIVAELAGVNVVDAVPQGDFSLDRYFMDLRTTVPPIPTYIELSTEGLEFPVAALDDDEAVDMFEAAGIAVLRITEKVKLRWDELTEDLIVDNLVVELGDVGKVRASARLGGLSKSILRNPHQFQALIATLNLKSFELELINEGGVQTALALMAKDADVSENLMAELLLEQLRGALAAIGNEEFTKEVMKAAEVFFADPRNLAVAIAPGRSVPVSQIAASVMTAPHMLPDLLGVTIEANR